MIELLVLAGAVVFGLAVLIGILKLMWALVLLPFKAAFWMAKGLLGLVIAVPLLIIGYLLIANVFPLILLVLLLPVIVLVVAVGFVLSLFC
jgi:hypothetical protein